MAIVEEERGPDTGKPAPRIARKPRTAAAAVPDLVFDMVARQTALIEEQGKSLMEMHDIIKNLQDTATLIQAPDGSFMITRKADPAPDAPPAPELSKDQYLVHTVFMDFIEIHGALSKSFRDRRPMLANAVQARYTDNSELSLMIMRKGEFGTNDEMFNTALTLKIHDDEPYIDGDYMNFGRTVNMSIEQVKRCVTAILTAIRQEESANDR